MPLNSRGEGQLSYTISCRPSGTLPPSQKKILLYRKLHRDKAMGFTQQQCESDSDNSCQCSQNLLNKIYSG